MPKKQKNKTAGLPPGSIVFTGKKKVEKINIHYLQYNETALEEEHINNQNIKRVFSPTLQLVQWYDTRGLHDTLLIEQIGKAFEIHPLVLEDIADIQQRPKYEDYSQGSFIALHALSFDRNQRKIHLEQITIYVGNGFLLSFQEDDTDLFKDVRIRLKAEKGKIRQKGADYLAYALLDSIVDHYFVILDEIQEVIEHLENEILTNPNEGNKAEIHHLKQEILIIRKSVAPLREAISRMIKPESNMIKDSTRVFIRDLHDHTIQVIDMVESYRDLLSGLQDLYLSEISFRMNKVMQLLTIITTIFVPLSFLTGLYGMNFDHMPELHWQYGYFILLGIMVIVVVGLLGYFKKNRWL